MINVTNLIAKQPLAVTRSDNTRHLLPSSCFHLVFLIYKDQPLIEVASGPVYVDFPIKEEKTQ
jgi:hypothetical protein